jgi:predicted transcriptional regulator
MSETIKMTDTELVEVRALQEKFQQKMFQLGQNTLQRLQATSTLKVANEQETKLGDEWVALQKEENQLIDKLLAKYGEGSLDLNAGTFIAEKKPTPS